MEVFDENIVRLIRQHLAGTITEEDRNELEGWIAESDEHSRFFEQIREDRRMASEFRQFCDIDSGRGWDRFAKRTQRSRRGLMLRVLKYTAMIILPLGVSVWLMNQQETEQVQAVSVVDNRGEKKIMLVLPDGEKIALDAQDNEIQVDRGIKARKTDEGLKYDRVGMKDISQLAYNTLQIPRGGEFALVLSDGTRVLLNSATSLKYPVTFDGKERKVYLSGEAYFEVATDSTRPFYVVTDGAEVRVYGTSFNVNSHREKEVQTVLVRGKVGVKSIHSGREYLLQPGDLATFNREDETIKVKHVDVRQYTAWTKGVFTFEEERLEDIMKTLSLWYDVNVFFQVEALKELHFSGHLERYKDIQNILDVITDATGVKFSIKEQTIVISR